MLYLLKYRKRKVWRCTNLGMDICTGKYITFVDADDYVHPDMLRVLYDRMTEDDYDVAQCGVSCFKADKPNVLEVNDLKFKGLIWIMLIIGKSHYRSDRIY